ncbi:MAG: hypothetical protein ACRDOO_20740 [Actinomadura sp.]
MWGRGTALVVGIILLGAGCGEGRDRTGESAERQTAAILSHRDTSLDFPSAGGLEAFRGEWSKDTGPLRLLAFAGLRGLRDAARIPSPRPGRPVRVPPRPAPAEPSAVPLPIVTGTTWSPAPDP